MSTVLTVMLFGNINAEAASLTSQQKKIYKECMSDYLNKTDWPDWWTSYVGDHTKECTEFAVADLNNDGVKELLVYSNAGASWQWGAVYRVNKKPLAVTYYDNGKKRRHHSSVIIIELLLPKLLWLHLLHLLMNVTDTWEFIRKDITG